MNTYKNKASTLETRLLVVTMIFVIPGFPLMIFTGLFWLQMALEKIAAHGLTGSSILTIAMAMCMSFIPLYAGPELVKMFLAWTNFIVNDDESVVLQRHHLLKTHSGTIESQRIKEIGVMEPDNSDGSEDLWHSVYAVLDDDKAIFVYRNTDSIKAIDKARGLAICLSLPEPKLVVSGARTYQTHAQLLEIVKSKA